MNIFIIRARLYVRLAIIWTCGKARLLWLDAKYVDMIARHTIARAQIWVLGKRMDRRISALERRVKALL